MAKAKQVLVVDDELDICETIRDELMDLDVETAYTYEQAQGKMAKGSYDCIVLDIMGVMGFELLEEFGKKFPNNSLSLKTRHRPQCSEKALY